MKNILRIVFLGLVGFSLLVYLTVPDFTNSEKNIENISFSMLPKYFDVVGKNPYTKKELIQEESDPIIINRKPGKNFSCTIITVPITMESIIPKIARTIASILILLPIFSNIKNTPY